MTMSKLCYLCGEEKDLAAFGGSPEHYGIPASYNDKCSVCVQKIRANRKRIRERIKADPAAGRIYGRCGKEDVRLVREGWVYKKTGEMEGLTAPK
jgi:hypothetical protein